MKKIKGCLLGIVMFSILSGCSAMIEEYVYEARAKEFSREVAGTLATQDYDTYIEMLDSLKSEEYELLSDKEKQELEEYFYETTDMLIEELGENWNKKIKFDDFKGSTVSIPERTAIEFMGTIYTKIGKENWFSFVIELVEEDEQFFLTDGFWFLESIRGDMEMYIQYDKFDE